MRALAVILAVAANTLGGAALAQTTTPNVVYPSRCARVPRRSTSTRWLGDSRRRHRPSSIDYNKKESAPAAGVIRRATAQRDKERGAAASTRFVETGVLSGAAR
jgi:hypothetical protein